MSGWSILTLDDGVAEHRNVSPDAYGTDRLWGDPTLVATSSRSPDFWVVPSRDSGTPLGALAFYASCTAFHSLERPSQLANAHANTKSDDLAPCVSPDGTSSSRRFLFIQGEQVFD
ncbi:hypothetical protein RhiJN_10138 [Ceratobasidium sp. AG-Ba]|nr:hypothetical protein RhiJN_10138 [Ceratobasidium sp. AG-Ba]QRW10892.1 hypothetical protein RhiLY_09891 [Ceratobasidium sp. AG-Ba]